MSDDEPIEHRFVTKAIGNAQKKVEGHNFDIRKHLLEYDDVMSQQRKTIYALRREVLEGRYAPDAGTLTDEERKAGKKPEPPTESGKWTNESLSEQLRPKIKEVVEAHAERAAVAAGKPPGESEDGAPYRESASMANLDAELDHRALTHDLYRYFGAVVDLQSERKSPKDCMAKAITEVAASLIQQRERVLDMADALIGEAVGLYCDENTHSEEWDIGALEESLSNTFNVKIDLAGVEQTQSLLAQKAYEQVETVIEAREEELGPIYFLYFSRHFLLEEIDNQWIEHLRNMDHLREGIGLRGYGQRDPKQEYKKEGFSMFAEMMDRIYGNAVDKLFKVQLAQEEEDALPTRYQRKKRKMSLGRGNLQALGDGEGGEEDVEIAKTVRRDRPKIGRNDPCWCGSGKKYKRCHMRTDQESGSGYQQAQ
jgi:preprotein translocase subunit SecA